MLLSIYVIFSIVSVLLIIFLAYISEMEFIKVDKTGREYNANVLIAAPISVLGWLFTIILAYQSWNIEALYLSGGSVDIYVYQLDYLTPVWVVLFFVIVGLLAKMIFIFFINAAYEPKRRFQR